MIVKQHTTQNREIILAICDTNILGEKFEEKNKQLDLTSDFYKGTELTETEILLLLPKTHSLNIVGERSIKFAIKNNLISPEKVMRIKDIPYAISIFTIQE